MSEVLAQLEKKGGGENTYITLLVTYGGFWAIYNADGSMEKGSATFVREYLQRTGSQGSFVVSALKPATYVVMKPETNLDPVVNVLTNANTFPYNLSVPQHSSVLVL